ncbi:nucleotidyltransferase family protein [Microbacterium sp. bgisy203]|uniref:nucleotidyltransferase family protein n=1 Tax=Microbacterium sp. bgisy203 TaxID=3413799 RepID=UPI003D71CC5B
MSGTVGIVLAAGAGTRYGMPKALVVGSDGIPWIVRAVETLRAGGCARVVVALGAERAAAGRLVPAGDGRVEIVEVADWAEGLSASVRAALGALESSAVPGALTGASAAVLVPVDTPGLPAAAVARLAAGADVETLRRAVYDGVPGHPVVIGRSHWSALSAELAGDQGAGPYLAAHGAERTECGDLWDGADVDAPPA